ncbi:MAG: glycoside hydrolase family 3 C-terminal domain-containing protein [Roseburia sp.]|nr:glycoside hydrolase family 3 C-terminal domain-containing protein [Roseburia sp.]MCM1099440.1 glycoside hydrolase family 3 C-terminal domain-containing protein [Ruminococcus flavefaciens]
MEIERKLSKLTLEEKVKLLSGRDFWHTESCEPLELPGVMVSDGPHGLRKQGVAGDHLGIAASLPATCFPTSSASACSFDPALLEQVGRALGEECRKEDVAVLLGPGVNIKRNPLCGRNFEYFSEDPLLAGKLAAGFIRGVQSQGVGTSVKHFAANNQEKQRMWEDSVVDERALREIYLKAFEIAVKEAHPWTIMTAYNRLNGSYCSENKWLMEDVARGEWGFDGLFVTDWGAMSDPIESFRNGLNLEMPGTCKGTDRELLQAVQNGLLTEADIDRAAGKVLELLERAGQRDKIPFVCDMEAHSELAGEVARRSAVLLKNDGLLPVKPGAKLAVIGSMAKSPRYQGAGSSKICPHSLDNFCQALEEAGISFDYAEGYSREGTETDERMLREAAEIARDKDVVLVFAGLPDTAESEGYDREHMDLPPAHNALIQAVADANPNIAVVLQCGSPVALPWAEQVRSILLMYLSGQQGGHAAWDLLSGKACPEGKLAETWPLSIEDTPNRSTFATGEEQVQYRESIYVGYRYYDTAQKAVAYPFGYGLSYTSFDYRDLEIKNKTVSCTVKNVGSVFGGEAVQLYLSLPDSKVFRAQKELKAFRKVRLAPGEEARIKFELTEEMFSWFDPRKKAWEIEPGAYRIQIGSSSRDIRLTGEICLEDGTVPEELPYTAGSADQIEFERLLGHSVPEDTPRRPFTRDSLLLTTKDTWIGKLILTVSIRIAAKETGGTPQAVKMARETMESMPIRGLSMGGGNRNMIYGVVDIFNGHLLRGLKKILKR